MDHYNHYQPPCSLVIKNSNHFVICSLVKANFPEEKKTKVTAQPFIREGISSFECWIVTDFNEISSIPDIDLKAEALNSFLLQKTGQSIKQLVVTKCSKERPGSIVNETLKNGILMLIDTSKESDVYADFK